MKIQYNGIEFTFNAKPVNGFYFTHNKNSPNLLGLFFSPKTNNMRT